MSFDSEGTLEAGNVSPTPVSIHRDMKHMITYHIGITPILMDYSINSGDDMISITLSYFEFTRRGLGFRIRLRIRCAFSRIHELKQLARVRIWPGILRMATVGRQL